MDKEACDTCEGEGAGGGGMLMDGASVDTSELGRGGRQIRRKGGLLDGAYGDTCGGE